MNLTIILLSSLAALLLLFITKFKNFFSLPHKKWSQYLNFFEVLGGFTLYFSISFLFIFIFHRWLKLFSPLIGISLFNLCFSFSLLISLLMYWWLVLKITKRDILLLKKEIKVDVKEAIRLWLISFPIVLIISNLLEQFILSIYGLLKLPEQDAVLLVRICKNSPPSIAMLALSIIILTPIIEEFLFRGLLQGYFRNFLSPWVSILLSSLFFTGLHFSFSQGLGNIPLLFSLYILSIFLGLAYEKRHSLSAPIILHSIFNFLSFVFLYFSSGA